MLAPKHIIFIAILLGTFQGYGQFAKDTLAGKYGPHTVWTREIGNEDYVNLDTSISNIYQYDPKYRVYDFYQDLGAFGSAYRKQFGFGKDRSVFRELSEDHYEDYGFSNDRKFYRTYSPYARLTYDLGSMGDVLFDGMYTRNVHRRWNLGFQFRRLKSKAMFPVIAYNSLVNSTSFRFFTSYVSKNERYSLLADYHSLNYQTDELGGIDLDGFGILEGYRYWGNLDAMMDAYSRYEGRHYFLKQNYSFDSAGKVMIFHQLDAGRKKHKFIDEEPYGSRTPKEALFYPDSFLHGDYTFIQWKNTVVKNQFGLMGNLGKVAYSTSLHHRMYQYVNEDFDSKLKLEMALQVSGGLNLSDSTHFNFDLIQSGTGAFNYSANLNLPFLEASVYSKNSLPYLIQENFTSNHYKWSGTLKNTYLVGGNVFIKNNKKFKLGASYDLLSNYTYFDENLNIIQESGTIGILAPELRYEMHQGRFNVETHVRYNVFLGNRVLGLPNLNSRLKVFYDLKMFNGALKSSLGTELRNYSDYYAYGYMPVFHEFYYQNDVKSYSTPWLSGFFDFRIKTVRMFIRGENLLGYATWWNFPTPNYPSKPLNIAFGVEWRFYD